MKTKFISAALSTTLACALYLTPGLAAASDYITSTVKVRATDLDLNSATGAAVLYERIERAADDVCGGRPGARRLHEMPDWMACRDEAITNAVARVDSDQLTAVHSEKETEGE